MKDIRQGIKDDDLDAVQAKYIHNKMLIKRKKAKNTPEVKTTPDAEQQQP